MVTVLYEVITLNASAQSPLGGNESRPSSPQQRVIRLVVQDSCVTFGLDHDSKFDGERWSSLSNSSRDLFRSLNWNPNTLVKA